MIHYFFLFFSKAYITWNILCFLSVLSRSYNVLKAIFSDYLINKAVLSKSNAVNSTDAMAKLKAIQKDKLPELTMGKFFDFMRMAYQVNNTFEELTMLLSANSEIDWNELAKIDLNVDGKDSTGDSCHQNSNSNTEL